MAKNWKSPNSRYHSAKSAAKLRRNEHGTIGIPWELTFEQWWKIWRDSGKWEQRGSVRGKYGMARIGDQGAYAVGNVFIQEHGANSSAGLVNWPAKKAAREAAEATGKSV